MHATTKRPCSAKAKITWMACVIAGLVVLAFSPFVMSKFPDGGGPYPPGFGAPVFAFEMARTPNDLIAIFGASDDPDRARRIREMNEGNLWDYPYMLAYGAFLLLFFVSLELETGDRLWRTFAAVGAAAAFADALENVILLSVTSEIEKAAGLQFLPYAVWTKFFGIMLCGLAGATFLFGRKQTIWKLAGALAIMSSSTIVLAFCDAARFGWLLSSGIGVAWIVMLTFAGARRLTPRCHRRTFAER